jgi:hypothetical protein
MCKDRVRSVGWSNHRPSPHHTVLTTARVGPYGYIHTIYIRRYGHRPTTLILYTSHRATYLWDHIIYRPASSPIYGLTRCHIHMSHRPPKATDHRIIGSPKATTHAHVLDWLAYFRLPFGSPLGAWATIHPGAPSTGYRLTTCHRATWATNPLAHQPPSPLGVWITGAMSHRVTGLPSGTLPDHQITGLPPYHLHLGTPSKPQSHNHHTHRCQATISHRPPDTRC